ncbi:MAG: SCO family protein [Bacteroidetes bacterium]|nr:SCO family protein [Bacteroidota bacterium]HET6243197.1 SCO family protein [Bacteroidia bacterium]
MSENKRNRYLKTIFLVVLLLLPASVYFILTLGKHNMLSLPFYGEKDVEISVVDGKQVVDTIYHTVKDFAFVNQHGDIVTQKNFEDKIYVADFFFTTCPGICPKMTAGMLRVQEKLKDFPQVMFLSHTVDPEKDTVEALAAYAQQAHAGENWHFVTGNKDEIYKQGVYSYLVSAEEDVLAPGGFLHSELFVLIDKKKRIRGFYDGTSLTEINKLIDAIKVLIAEEMVPKKSKKKEK